MVSSDLYSKSTNQSPRTVGLISISNGVPFRSSGLPLTPDTCRRTLQLTSSGSCRSDRRRSAAQNHNRRCSTATAQQNNFVTTDTGAVVADVAPYFGHPEIDLALVDYFHPVPNDVFDAYRDIARIEAGFSCNDVTSGVYSSISRASPSRPSRLAATHWLAWPLRFAGTNNDGTITTGTRVRLTAEQSFDTHTVNVQFGQRFSVFATMAARTSS